MSNLAFIQAPESDWAIPLLEAMEQYVAEYPSLAPRTVDGYRIAIKTWARILEEGVGKTVLLSEINSSHVTYYQKYRMAKKLSHAMINRDVGVLRTVMRWAGIWSNVKRYRALPPDPPKEEYIPTEADLLKIITVGMRHRRWEVGLWAAVLSANTGMGPQEILHLKMKDIHLGSDPLDNNAGHVNVARKCKTLFRYRAAPLNANAHVAVQNLIQRLRRLGFGNHPEHHLIPFRINSSSYDPFRPGTTFNNSWKSILKKAGLPSMRRYVLRHYFGTALNNIPELTDATKKSLMGHSGRSRVLERTYTHIRQETKAKAVAHLGVEVPGVLYRNIAPKPNSEEVDQNLVKLVQSVAFEAMTPFMEEAKRDVLRKAAATQKSSEDPPTPGAHLYPHLNLAAMWGNIDRSHPDGCWVWVGPMQTSGKQGACWTGTENKIARRVVYEVCVNDPLPDSRIRLYPKCLTAHCVNPEHMQVGIRLSQELRRPKQDEQPALSDTPGSGFYPTLDLRRLWNFIDHDKERDCWNWKGEYREARPAITVSNHHVVTRRATYEICTGNRINPTDRVYSLCENRKCVNPAHVRIGAMKRAPRELTYRPKQAMEILDMNRSQLTRLLETRAIPSHKTGRHTRMYARDIFAYRAQMAKPPQRAVNA